MRFHISFFKKKNLIKYGNEFLYFVTSCVILNSNYSKECECERQTIWLDHRFFVLLFTWRMHTHAVKVKN